jgi:oxygen-dependent protoporphyrinogen oxidase
MHPVVIIGGGISGLATAFYLKKAGIPAKLIEAQPRLGGLIGTEVIEGCRVEAGPESWLTAKPAARELVSELGLADQIIGSNDHRRAVYIWRKGKLVRMPTGMRLMVPTSLKVLFGMDLISFGGKLRAAREIFFRPPKNADAENDRSVAEFVIQHFGRELLDYIAEPLLAGVYGGDPKELSASSVIPQMVEWEKKHGSLIRAAAAHKMEGAQPLFSTMKEGMGQLIDALARAIDAEVIHGSAEKIEKGWRVRVNGDWINASHVVVACQPHRVLPDLFPPISYTSSAIMALGYRRSELKHPLNGFGFLVPTCERQSLAATTWVGTKFDYRVPEDKAIIRCFLTGNVNDVYRELKEKMGITAEPIFERFQAWPNSMPQYTIGHAQRTRVVEEMLQDLPGLHLAGNSYYGVGVPDSIRTAKHAATTIAAAGPSKSAS